MNLPLVPNFDGDNFEPAELREAISELELALDNKDPEPAELMLGLEHFQTNSRDPDARFPEAFQKAVVDALHAYDPWARAIVSLRNSSRELIVRYDREFDSNLSFIMKTPA
jgi:hypothetical protein